MILFLLKFFNFCWGRPSEVPNPGVRNPTYASATNEVAPSHQICDMTVNYKLEGTWLLQLREPVTIRPGQRMPHQDRGA
jgi:hypothetical protein